jgi:heat shock protein HtpX
MPSFGLYSHIQANRRRSIALLIGLLLLAYVVVFAVTLLVYGYRFPTRNLDVLVQFAKRDFITYLPLTTLAIAAWVALAYFFNTRMIDAMTGAQALERSENPRLYDQLEALCISVGMAMPQLKIIDDPALNAFASGVNPQQYAVTVTRGLLETLNPAEVEAVLAHELTHIRNGDVRMMIFAVIIAGVVSLVGELLFRFFMNFNRAMHWSREDSSNNGNGASSSRDKSGGGAMAAFLIAIALMVIAWIFSQLIRFALSRTREYLADAGAVELTKDPDAMISALQKISGNGAISGVPSGIMEMCLDNPLSGFTGLFSTHPSIENRINALVTQAGGRV